MHSCSVISNVISIVASEAHERFKLFTKYELGEI
jgi:hypothetical protein